MEEENQKVEGENQEACDDGVSGSVLDGEAAAKNLIFMAKSVISGEETSDTTVVAPQQPRSGNAFDEWCSELQILAVRDEVGVAKHFYESLLKLAEKTRSFLEKDKGFLKTNEISSSCSSSSSGGGDHNQSPKYQHEALRAMIISYLFILQSELDGVNIDVNFLLLENKRVQENISLLQPSIGDLETRLVVLKKTISKQVLKESDLGETADVLKDVLSLKYQYGSMAEALKANGDANKKLLQEMQEETASTNSSLKEYVEAKIAKAKNDRKSRAKGGGKGMKDLEQLVSDFRLEAASTRTEMEAAIAAATIKPQWLLLSGGLILIIGMLIGYLLARR